MPHLPDLRPHADHDLELVAAYASGDAAGADLETAAALVSGCAECAGLHHDLRAIAAALPDLPAPVRPRDFRLTPEQAASLRPGGWRGLLAAFAGPRFRLATPLGTGLAALGLAGLLVGSLGGIPLGAGGAAMSARAPSDQAAGYAASAAPAGGAPSAVPEAAPGESSGTDTSNGPAPVASPNPAGSAPPPAVAASPGTGALGPAASGAPGDLAGGSRDAGGIKSLAPEQGVIGGLSASSLLAVGGAIVFLAGALLVAVRLASRRLA